MTREKEPFIHRDDRIMIVNGAPGGWWDVRDARWAKRDDASNDDIELVLGRGSMYMKTLFTKANMQHQSNRPADVLSRDINVQKPLTFRPK